MVKKIALCLLSKLFFVSLTAGALTRGGREKGLCKVSHRAIQPSRLTIAEASSAPGGIIQPRLFCITNAKALRAGLHLTLSVQIAQPCLT